MGRAALAGVAFLALLLSAEALRPIAVLQATIQANDDLDLVAHAALPEFLAPADERFAFLVDTLLNGLPDPGNPRAPAEKPEARNQR